MQTVRLFIAAGILALQSCTPVYASDIPAQALRHSADYLQVRERTNNNDHPQIDKWLAYLGLPKRLSWCAAYVVNMYGEAAADNGVRNPLPKYGRVAMLYDYAKANELRFRVIDTDDILAGTSKARPGDIAIWLYGAGPNPNGHTGLVRGQATRHTQLTREGNTGPGKGVVREGNGVYDRERATTSMAAIVRVR